MTAEIVGKDFVDFEIEYVDDGKRGKLSDLVGDKPIVMDFYTTWWGGCNGAAVHMEKHATDDGDKATYVMICIQDRNSALQYKQKHNLKNVVHVVAKPPAEYVAFDLSHMNSSVTQHITNTQIQTGIHSSSRCHWQGRKGQDELRRRLHESFEVIK